MKWAFELLGLPPDADALSVKRSYARLLRTTRPDDDPAAFQRLHTAYKIVLAQASASSAPATPATGAISHLPEPLARPPSNETPAGATQHTPQAISLARPTASPVANIGALANEVIRAAIDTDSGRELSSWLQSRQAFWSIQVKQQTGKMVIQSLFQQPQTMSSDCLDALLRFFDLDHVLSGINPIALQQLRRRQSLRWELMPEHHYEFAQRIQLRRQGRPDMDALKQYLKLLQQPLAWLPIVRTALRRSAINRLGHFIHALCHGHLDDLPTSFDQRSVRFWYRATGAGAMSWPRFAVNSLRVTAIALICALLTTAVFVVSFASGNIPGKDALRFSTVFSFTIIAGLLGLWSLFAGWIYLDHWQGLPESAPSRLPWLRRLVIPALCVISLALYEAGAPTFIAGPLAFAGFVLAVRRFRRRSTQRASKRALRIGSMVPLFAYLCIIAINAMAHAQSDSDLQLITVAVFVTVGTWLADMWRHRTHLHPKFTRN